MTEITERLHLERDALSSSDVDEGLRNVRRTVRRRRRQNSFIGAAAAGGLLVAGIGVASVVGSDTEEVVVTDTAPAVTTGTEAAATPASTAPPVTTTAPGSNDATTLEPVPVVPSVGAPVAGLSIDSQRVDVTDEVRAAVGDARFSSWHVAWNGGFLIGSNGSETEPWSAFFSADGRTWEPVEFAPGITGPTQHGISVVDGRLVLLGNRGDWQVREPVVASTTDLVNWTVEEIPITPPPPDLPAAVSVEMWPTTIAANAEGWIATVSNSLRINESEVAAQRLGRPVTGGTIASSDEGMLFNADPEAAGGETEEVWITWAELEDELGSDLLEQIRAPAPAEVWAGTWDGAPPTQVEDLGELARFDSTEPIIAIGNQLVTVRSSRELPDDGPPVYSTEVVTSEDRITWSVLDVPIPQQVVSAFPLDGDLGVFVRSDDATISVYRVDLDTETWTAIEVPGLPPSARYVDDSASSVVSLDAAPPDDFATRPSTSVFEQNGRRLTWSFEDYISSYQVTSIDTGEIVVAESVDIRDVEGSFDLAFEHLTGGFVMATTIVDPETGEVLMDITVEEMEAANPQEPYFGPDPEPWIVATQDGISWFVYEVPPSISESGGYVEGQMTVSDGRLLVQTRTAEWFVVDLT